MTSLYEALQPIDNDVIINFYSNNARDRPTRPGFICRVGQRHLKHFNISYSFLLLTVAKLSALRSSVFLPTLYIGHRVNINGTAFHCFPSWRSIHYRCVCIWTAVARPSPIDKRLYVSLFMICRLCFRPWSVSAVHGGHAYKPKPFCFSVELITT